MKITNSANGLFVALKGTIAEAASRENAAVQRFSLGQETTCRVVDSVTTTIFAEVPDSNREHKEVEIKPHSIVDNRPETVDVIYFRHGDQHYRIREERAFNVGKSSNGHIAFGPLESMSYVIHQYNEDDEKWSM